MKWVHFSSHLFEICLFDQFPQRQTQTCVHFTTEITLANPFQEKLNLPIKNECIYCITIISKVVLTYYLCLMQSKTKIFKFVFRVFMLYCIENISQATCSLKQSLKYNSLVFSELVLVIKFIQLGFQYRLDLLNSTG